MANKTAYIRFFTGVNAKTVKVLMQTVEQKLKEGAERFVILISSSGGNVSAGISAYNFLKGIPAEVVTHNFGDAYSIALILFCAGSKRLCVPHARFLLHGIGFDVKASARFDEHSLDERIKGLRLDRETIASIIADSTEGKKKVKDVDKDFLSNTVLNSQQAIDYGLAHEIRTEVFPKGAEIISITD
jgi:ATP-dependent protease ClpP protease subunit